MIAQFLEPIDNHKTMTLERKRRVSKIVTYLLFHKFTSYEEIEDHFSLDLETVKRDIQAANLSITGKKGGMAYLMTSYAQFLEDKLMEAEDEIQRV